MAKDAFDEPLDLEDDWDDEPPAPSGFTMRHPILLVLVLAGSAFMLVKYWPRVAYMIDASEPADCGNLSDRPIQRSTDAASLPPLTHDTYCHLEGVVQNFTILSTGGEDGHVNPKKRLEGRKYYVKLDGDKVFAVVSAERRDIIRHRARQASLLGFHISTTGRMIDPDVEPGYAATAKTLRVKFGLSREESLRIFDTTDVPSSRWPAAVGSVFLLVTGLFALWGLLRIVLVRLRDEEDDVAPPAARDEPDADEPDADEPDADEPDADEPDADEPDADDPEAPDAPGPDDDAESEAPPPDRSPDAAG